MLRRGRERDSVERYTRVSESERFDSIKKALRKPGADERQIIGRLDAVDCSAGTNRITATTAGGGKWLFTAPLFSTVAVNWFSSAGLNFRLSCGSAPEGAHALLTYKESTVPNGLHELTAIEFIPSDIQLPVQLSNAGVKGN
jgi:hypothetical protein